MGAGTAVGMGAGTAVGMEAGTAAGGTVVGGMAAIGIVGVGGPATAGAGGAGAVGIPTRLGVNILTAITAITAAVMANRPAPKTKPQRFNRGWLISVSITARSTAKSVQGQKVPSKLSRPSTVYDRRVRLMTRH